MSHLLERALSTPTGIIASGIVLIATIFVVYKLATALLGHSGSVTRQVLSLLGTIVGEIGGSRIKPYERINGVTVAVLALCAVVFLVLVVGERVVTVFGKHSDPTFSLAIFIFLTALTAGTGLICVRFVSRHKDDVAAAKRLQRRKE